MEIGHACLPYCDSPVFRAESKCNPRLADGRFVKGNAGGPGNPFARRTAALRRALAAVVTEEDVQALVRVLLKMALAGDVAAVKAPLAYVIGKPAEAVDPDAVDLREWRLLRQAPLAPEYLTVLLNRLPPDMACAILHAGGPILAAANVGGIAKHIADMADGAPKK